MLTRLELFTALCDATDQLELLVLPKDYTAARYAAMHADVTRWREKLDALIDRLVRNGMEPLHEADTSPCPHCGQAVCTNAVPS